MLSRVFVTWNGNLSALLSRLAGVRTHACIQSSSSSSHLVFYGDKDALADRKRRVFLSLRELGPVRSISIVMAAQREGKGREGGKEGAIGRMAEGRESAEQSRKLAREQISSLDLPEEHTHTNT